MALLAAPATAQQPVQLAQVQACPDTFSGLGAGDSLRCTCPTTPAAGDVWGTATYTDDSAICAAAAHAGAIGPDSDMLLFGQAAVTVSGTAGCESYAGSSRNGVTTRDYGPWSGSFYFPDISGPGCAQSFAAALRDCPASLSGMSAGTVLDCQCPADAAGSVWGTWTYTDDSALCAAARHAGAVGAGGGPVRVATFDGCDGYVGSDNNGMVSADYGAWSGSIYFPAVSGPGCVAPAAPELRNYAIHFVGMQCVQRAQPFFLEQEDAVLAVAFVVEADGTIREPHTLPRDDDYYQGMVAGAYRQADVVVWQGLTQDVDLHALLYKYDPVLPEIVGGLIRATSAVGGALIAIGTGGAGAVAGAGAALAGDAAASAVQERMREVATPLGHSATDVDLTRVGDPAAQPMQRSGPISYHFKTTHTDRGGVYELYWVVR
ncbi:MAG: LCCL domain-containing protein [Alphaproteobacteria bacterium]